MPLVTSPFQHICQGIRKCGKGGEMYCGLVA